MTFGGYDVNVNVNGMPQKVATAFDEITNTLLGAKYNPIAYLGTQVVNGTNHAILAEQTIITGVDSKCVVVMVINEKDQGLTLAAIERVLDSGEAFGGTSIDCKTDIPDEAMPALSNALSSFISGATIKSFAYLGSQLANGMNYYIAAEVSPLVAGVDNNTSVKLIKVNSKDPKFIEFTDIV